MKKRPNDQCSPWSGLDRPWWSGPVQLVSWTGSVQSCPVKDWVRPRSSRLKSQVCHFQFSSIHLPRNHPAAYTSFPRLQLLPPTTPARPLIPSHVYNTYSLPGNGVLDYRWQDTQGNLFSSLVATSKFDMQGLRTDMATPVPLRGSPPKLHLFFLKRKRTVPAMCGYLPTGRRLWSTGRLDEIFQQEEFPPNEIKDVMGYWSARRLEPR